MTCIIASTPNFKLHPSLTSGLSPPHNNPNTTKLISFLSKPVIVKCSLSDHTTLKFPNPICKYLQDPDPDLDRSHTHKQRNKRSIRAKTSTIPVPELESKTHKIWWSDVVVKYPKNVFGRKLKEWDSVDILNLCYVGGMHVLALFAPFTFTWKAVLLAFVLAITTGWLGITLSFHRNLAHKSFKLLKWLEYIFAYCGVLASQPARLSASSLDNSRSQVLPPSIDELSSSILIGLPKYPDPDPDPSHTHKHIRSIRAKTSTIPVPELESKTHKIWWSDVIVKYPTKNVFVRKLKEWNSLDILNLCHVGAMHILALFAPFTFTWKAVWVALGLGIITGWLGITLSYHRNLAHRSFKLPKWLEYTFAYCGVLASQGDPIGWVSTHRYHHQFCDTEKDPHTPRKGFWFSHINWIFDTKAFARHEMPARLSSQSMETSNLDNSRSQDLPPSIDDLSSTSLLGLPKCGETNNIEDLEKQLFYRFIRSTYVVHRFLLGLLLYAFGGFPYVVWGMGVRTIVAYHTTFLVTSAAHVWGHQSWNTGDLSKNNWWIALLTSGEGWHNNHHAFPYSAKHGMEWWQIDLTWYAIKLLQVVGLATDVKLPTEPHKTRLAFKHETT